MMTIEKFIEETMEGKTESDQASHLSWLNSYRKDWMTDDQWLLSLFLCRLFSGFHHVPSEVKSCGRGLMLNFRPNSMSTFDFDDLTKLVVMAHNWGVRAEIGGSGPAMIKLMLWKRHVRDGNISQRHPTIDQAVEKFKSY
jgi:hypothetical protein